MHIPGSSIALLRHPEQMERLWLAWWNRREDAWDFVTAERLENESFRECLDREIAWVLPLQRSQQYLISSVARLHLDLSADEMETTCAVEFYVVDLYGRTAQEAVDSCDQLRWLSGSELLSGETADGAPVSPRLVKLLQKADVIPRYDRSPQ